MLLIVFIPAVYLKHAPLMVVAKVKENRPNYTSIVQASTSFISVKSIGQRSHMTRPKVKSLGCVLYEVVAPFTVTRQKKWMYNGIPVEGIPFIYMNEVYVQV